jgi:hypothetical protein
MFARHPTAAQLTNPASIYVRTSKFILSSVRKSVVFTNPRLLPLCSNWEPPCLNYCLGPSQNNQQLLWIAPAPGGPGPYQDYNWTIGSWGPSNGVTTYWVDQKDNNSTWYQYPGTGQVNDYWKQNIWTWYAFWGQ